MSWWKKPKDWPGCCPLYTQNNELGFYAKCVSPAERADQTSLKLFRASQLGEVSVLKMPKIFEVPGDVMLQ